MDRVLERVNTLDWCDDAVVHKYMPSLVREVIVRHGVTWMNATLNAVEGCIPSLDVEQQAAVIVAAFDAVHRSPDVPAASKELFASLFLPRMTDSLEVVARAMTVTAAPPPSPFLAAESFDAHPYTLRGRTVLRTAVTFFKDHPQILGVTVLRLAPLLVTADLAVARDLCSALQTALRPETGSPSLRRLPLTMALDNVLQESAVSAEAVSTLLGALWDVACSEPERNTPERGARVLLRRMAWKLVHVKKYPVPVLQGIALGLQHAASRLNLAMVDALPDQGPRDAQDVQPELPEHARFHPADADLVGLATAPALPRVIRLFVYLDTIGESFAPNCATFASLLALDTPAVPGTEKSPFPVPLIRRHALPGMTRIRRRVE
jgi:hypothetical protein